MNLMSVFKEQVKNFPPPYFSVAMATGILALGANLVNLDLVRDFMFVLTISIYLLLVLLYVVRCLWFFPKVKMDLAMHMKGPGFLTFVVATNILGIDFVQIGKNYLIAQFLLGLGMISWLIILYSFLLGTSLKSRKPPVMKAVSGSWLLVVVSTQSIVILTGFVEKSLPSLTWLLDFSLMLWLLGLLLYIILVTLVLYRLVFLSIKPEKISPSFWLDAGAAAAVAFAGATILNSAPAGHDIAQHSSVIKVLILMGWIAAFWWLVLLVLQEIWRHIKVGFSYSVGYWSLAFPLGIFAVASKKMSQMFSFPVLNDIGNIFIYVGLVLWVFVFVSMIIHFIKVYKKSI